MITPPYCSLCNKDIGTIIIRDKPQKELKLQGFDKYFSNNNNSRIISVILFLE